METMQEIFRIIDVLDSAQAHTLGLVMETLGVTPKLSARSTPYSRLLDGEVPDGPFGRMDFRLAARSDAQRRSFLILYVRQGVVVPWQPVAAHLPQRPVYAGSATSDLTVPEILTEIRRPGQRLIFTVNYASDTLQSVIFDRA